MSDQAFEFLSGVYPFSNLSEEELTDLARKIWIEKKTKSALLYTQGKSEVESLILVKSGSLEAYHEVAGTKTFADHLGRADICGGVSIVMNAGISFRTVSAGTDASFYIMPKNTFLEICERHEGVKDFFIDIYNRRMLDESYATTLATGQAFQFLSGVVPFSFLPDDEIEKTATKLSIVHYPEGSVVGVQGRTRFDCLYILQKGAAERYYEENDRKKLRGLLQEGDVCGGVTILLNDGVAVRTMKCTEDSYFYVLSKKNFMELCAGYEPFSEYFTDKFGKRMLNRSYAAVVSKTMLPRDEEQQFFNQPVKNVFKRDLVSCRSDATIREAASVMARHECGSIFVKSPEKDFVGIVTDTDLRKKVVAAGWDIEKSVEDIMRSPVDFIAKDALIFEAMMAMTQKRTKYLAVNDGEKKVVGVVTKRDLIDAQEQSPFFLVREISEASTLDEIVDKRGRLPGVVKTLINNGAKAKNATRLITAISDTILEKLIGMAIEETGEPPADFVFMIMGSEGRKEQTLKTDQDNAIVYRDVPEGDEARVREYFMRLAEKVCTWLDRAGYDFCDGGNMAKNPKWTQPLSVWKEYFSSWIRAGGPEELLKSSIFFDFRGAYGDMEIIDELRRFLFDSLGGWAGFFRNLAENALYFKPPIGFFRNFVVASKGEHRDTFDIKSAMQPIVDFARIYALKHKIEETNTQDRLRRLYLNKALPRADYNELDQAYGFMMQLRFVRQISAVVGDGEKPDNFINPKKLSRIEQTMLKEIFKRIENLQAKLGFEFTGIG